MYHSSTLAHESLYIARLVKNSTLPYILFVNGGPGMSCELIQTLIVDHHLFNSLNYNIICYDQKSTGRSSTHSNITHQDNINDLKSIIDLIQKEKSIRLAAIIGHSYGAKLLADTYKQRPSAMPAIFVSTAESVLTPRINNLLLDLAYLKKINKNKYNEIYLSFNDSSVESIWKITEELSPLFQKNKTRPLLYWANLEKMKLVQNIQKEINNHTNQAVFLSVRKSLYENEQNLLVNIDSIVAPKLWINGFHDYIMKATTQKQKTKIEIFMKSSHYPHIEENEKFCSLVNAFLSYY